MEKDRSGKVIAIVALLVGVVGLTIGFAAFSNTLKIQSSAEVIQSSDAYNVDFSTVPNSGTSTATAGTVAPTLSPTTDGPTATAATIDNSNWDPVIRNLKATFSAPGQSVTYTFYTKNAGKMAAHLNQVEFAETATNSGVTQSCAPLSRQENANPATVDLTNICDDITLTVSLGETASAEDFTSTTARSAFDSATAHDLAINGYEKVTVVIAYAANPEEEADGDFSVTFGDVILHYSSQAN